MMSSKLLIRMSLFLVLFILLACLEETQSKPLSVSGLDAGRSMALTKFRSMVEKYMPHEYMKDGAYLLRYLSSKKFDLQKAKNSFKKNLVWRERERMDNILWEDWSDLSSFFPYDLPTLTAVNSSTLKDGPVLYFNYGSWNISQVVQSGDQAYQERFLRYVSAKMLEDADRKSRSLRRWRYPNDLAQFDIIVNLEGFTKEEQGCLECLQLLKEIIQNSEERYSGAVDNLVFINAPSSFDHAYPLIASAFHEGSQVTMKIQKEKVNIVTAQDGRVNQIVAKDDLITTASQANQLFY